MTADWRSILHELSDNIQNKVLTVIPRRGNLPNIKFKDLLDKQAQDAIVETLKEHEVSAKLVSEECDVVFGDGEYIITADPVDGTTNLSRGLQPAATSLSISETGTQSGVIAGIVANLYTGETWYAERGRCCWYWWRTYDDRKRVRRRPVYV